MIYDSFWSYCQTLYSFSSETYIDFSSIFQSADFPLVSSVSVSSVAGVFILEPVWSHPPISTKLQIHSGKAYIETQFVTNRGTLHWTGVQGDWHNNKNISEYSGLAVNIALKKVIMWHKVLIQLHSCHFWVL